MFKSVFAATAALFTSAGAALAGPYVNVETNASWAGDDYVGALTDIHVGYEGEVGSAGVYVQGGPAILAVDGVENETRLESMVNCLLSLPLMSLNSMILALVVNWV